jgi:hypothetical protein
MRAALPAAFGRFYVTVRGGAPCSIGVAAAHHASMERPLVAVADGFGLR